MYNKLIQTSTLFINVKFIIEVAANMRLAFNNCFVKTMQNCIHLILVIDVTITVLLESNYSFPHIFTGLCI